MDLKSTMEQLRTIIGNEPADAIGITPSLADDPNVAQVKRALSDLEPQVIGTGIVVSNAKPEIYRKALVGAVTADAISCDEAADLKPSFDDEYHGYYSGECFSAFRRAAASGAVVFISIPEANVALSRTKLAKLRLKADANVDLVAPDMYPDAVYSIEAGATTLYLAIVEREGGDDENDDLR